MGAGGLLPPSEALFEKNAQMGLQRSNSTTSQIGARVKVKVPLKVYHVPKIAEVDLTGMEGEIKQYVGLWKGKHQGETDWVGGKHQGPAPPLPQLHLSDEMVNEVMTFVRTRVNDLLSVSQDIALGKDSRLFLKVAVYLWLISIIGG
ncbi:hypothetical protein Fmac_018139 [Flemingia macrophylla]|uniref:Reticulon-like protein n=1 Tax=Flemingia macrophylla TaxID=520843 RepID=A0ABD1M4S1_9FABA